jgi:hypothetical protein
MSRPPHPPRLYNSKVEEDEVILHYSVKLHRKLSNDFHFGPSESTIAHTLTINIKGILKFMISCSSYRNKQIILQLIKVCNCNSGSFPSVYFCLSWNVGVKSIAVSLRNSVENQVTRYKS